MSFFKHVALHKYDLTDKGVTQACYDEMKADGYDIVITEKEMQVLARHSCLLYTSPSPRDRQKSRMPSSA